MRGHAVGVLGLVVGLAVSAPLQAQAGSSTITVKRGELAVVPYAGYIVTTHFAEPLGVSLGTADGALYGVQGALPLSPNASLVGGVAYSSASLRVGLPIIGGINVGNSKAYIYEGDLELRGGERSSGALAGFSPFLQVGAGAIHRNLSAVGLHATSTDFAINGGLGADFTVMKGLTLRLMAKDYVGKASFNSDIAETNTLNNIALSGGVRFTF